MGFPATTIHGDRNQQVSYLKFMEAYLLLLISLIGRACCPNTYHVYYQEVLTLCTNEIWADFAMLRSCYCVLKLLSDILCLNFEI